MTDKIQKPNNLSLETLTNEMRGKELGEEEKLWKEVASSEARIVELQSPGYRDPTIEFII